MLADAGRLKHRTRFTRAEKKVLKKQKYILPSVWAERHRVLTVSSLPGPWKNRVPPYLVGIMDGADYHSVREIVVCAAPQTGKSEAAHNFIGKKIDREPGPVMYCYPDEKTTGENSRDRVLPMIKNSARLRSYLTGVQKDEASYRIKLQHMPVYFSWASSPARLANKPIRYAVADEIDKYPETSGKKEANPLDLLDKRLATYRRQSKYWKLSTPIIEKGPIWTELQSCAAVFEYKVKDFNNGYEAIPWKDDQVDRAEELIYSLCDKRPEGLVPGEGTVAGLTAGVDTQDDGFWYCIRAWGHGLVQESWAVRLGFTQTFESLADILFAHRYMDADWAVHPVALVLIDSQGHRTREVYDYCRTYRGRMFPTKGERTMNTTVSYTALETYPGTNKKILGGLQLLRLNTTYCKNDLSSKLTVGPADPGAFHYHGELRQKWPQWATHMTVEYVDENGVWQCPDHKPNHEWDCEILNLAAADVVGIKFWAKPPSPGKQGPEKKMRVVKSKFIGG